ncbi:MAG: Long-chain-fatty-acid--CoA ligase [Acidobacteriales bacterium]|nr:Long-chain-fatty-acid--CoA ligase [Terriglobales bacterium]
MCHNTCDNSQLTAHKSGVITQPPQAVATSSDFRVGKSFTPPTWYYELAKWVQDPSTPSNVAHNYSLPLRIRGNLDLAALEGSIVELLNRHSVLRSSFAISHDGSLQQLITAPLQSFSLELIDLSDLREAERENKARKVIVEDAQRAFDLKQPPNLRAAVLRLADDDHLLLLTTHHCVCDDWSTGILVRDLLALYSSAVTAQAPALPALDYKYGQFVQWLNQKLSPEMQVHLNYWDELIPADNDFHHVVPDHERANPRTFKGAHEKLVLPSSLVSTITKLSQAERVSQFMFLLAALKCTLHAYSRERMIGVGTCVANRPLLELEQVVGPFANVVVLQTEISPDLQFREVLRRIRQSTLSAYSHQIIPFGSLVRRHQADVDPCRNPLFQVLFVFLNASSETWHAEGLSVTPYKFDTGTARYELNFWVKMREELEFNLQYNSDLFDRSSASRLLQDYRQVLEAVCANPELRVGEINLDRKTPRLRQVAEPNNIAGTRSAANAKPQGELQRKLLAAWESALNRRPISVNDDFFELGGDSLTAVRLCAQMGNEIGRDIPAGILFEAPTVAALVEVLTNGSSQDKCLVTLQAGTSTQTPLFCIPGQTGSVMMYRSLAKCLGADQPVFGLQPKGLDGSAPPYRRIEDMAANFIRSMKSVQPRGPYCLAGFCMGGTVAFEIAQQLQSSGESVVLLALIETYDWRFLNEMSRFDELYFRVQQWLFSWRPGGIRHKELRGRRDLKSLIAVGMPGRGTSLRANSDFWQKPAADLVSEGNEQAAMSYVPREYIGPILFVRPEKDYARHVRPKMSLKAFALSAVEEFIVPGYPSEMLEEPHAHTLAEKFRAHLNEAFQSVSQQMNSCLRS